MSGWVPMPAEVWPMVAPHLPQPWPEEAARFDLRWHVDQTGRLPSRSALAARWGWTRDEVRTELRHPERWWDTHRGPLPTSRDDLTQRDPARPRLTHADPGATGERQESAGPDPVRPNLTQADPAVPQRGDPPSPPPSPPPPEREQAPRPKRTPPPAPPSPLKAARECWQAAWGASAFASSGYPWAPGADKRPLTDAAAAAGLDGGEQPEQRARLTRAMSRYLAEAQAGTAWPPGAPTLRGFGQGVADWLLRADGLARAPQRPRPADDWRTVGRVEQRPDDDIPF